MKLTLEYLYSEIIIFNISDYIDEASKEIRLFSLKLQPSYELFGSKYALLGTVNYYVQKEEGGHYITHFFPTQNECLSIHESESRPQWKKPDFDAESVIVALQKIGGNVSFYTLWGKKSTFLP